MQNYLLTKKNKELEQLSKQLGFTKTFFINEDFVLIKANSKKELLSKIKQAKRKKLITIYQSPTEELLRFALEKTPIDIVFGMEQINPKDSVHFVRGGLDQILCKIAAEKGKIIAFSFSEILNSQNRPKLLARIIFNIKLCKKYKVKMLFSNFSKEKMEMRSKKDLEAWWKVLWVPK